MKLLVVSSIWPHGSHSIRAANIVIYEMLLAFSKQADLSIGLLVVGNSSAVKVKENEEKGIAALKDAGIDVLDPVILKDVYPKRSRLKRLFSPKIVDWYPACNEAKLIEQRVAAWQADVILVPWSEWLTHACSEIPAVKFAYYGNPDPKGTRMQLRLRNRFGEITRMQKIIEDVLLNRFERIHLQVMQRYELLGNVAKNDAEYYSKNGHPNAFYIQNIWMNAPIESCQKLRPSINPIKIIGSIGKLGGTANTLGLEYFGKEVIPALDIVLKDQPYEVHILGSGLPHKVLAQALDHPCVVWRGFVENIDEEIRDCDVFLCVNNATEYKVGHTRYLHAWSLSAPVVAHQDASLSMPEIKNNMNALLGRDAMEIAKQIGRIMGDEKLRAHIKENGFKTFNEKFTAKEVVTAIRLKIDDYIRQARLRKQD